MTEENKKEFKKADMIEVKKRIYQVGLMLRRKSVSFILQFCADNWNIENRQARNYIRKARKEWKKYFEKLEGDGISYHIAQFRDIKDKAYDQKVVIGRGDDKQVIEVPNLGLIFEISKEEAKLMGIYPAEKHKIEEIRKVSISDYTKEEKDKELERINDKLRSSREIDK